MNDSKQNLAGFHHLELYFLFTGIWLPGNKEMSKKGHVLRQSLSKMELVCYNIQIRGSEVPKHMLMSVVESSEVDDDRDEGFYWSIPIFIKFSSLLFFMGCERKCHNSWII